MRYWSPTLYSAGCWQRLVPQAGVVDRVPHGRLGLPELFPHVVKDILQPHFHQKVFESFEKCDLAGSEP